MNPFHIDPEEIPPGYDYQWVEFAVDGDLQRMREDGWRPVPYSRHPKEAEGYRALSMKWKANGDQHEYEERIVVGDLILVERPKRP